MPTLFFDVMYEKYPIGNWKNIYEQDSRNVMPLSMEMAFERVILLEMLRQLSDKKPNYDFESIEAAEKKEEELQKRRSQEIHDRIVAALEDEKRRLSTNTI